MTLSDAGTLYALVDPDQKEQHVLCKVILPSLSLPLLTTWPCFTEAMYLAHRSGGWPMQQLLWQYVHTGVLQIHVTSGTEIARMEILMQTYRDTPIDLADASLVAAAEILGERRIFSLDSHFRIYRINGKDVFDMIP